MKKLRLLIIGLLVLGGAVNASNTSTQAALSWTAPTTREDGSALALSEIAGYYLYLNGVKGTTMVTATSANTAVCGLGTYQVSAMDTTGHESKLSGSVTVDTVMLPGCLKPPAAPTGMKAVAI